MPAKPLACPYCRTWFEGSGRSVRCPACGKKFNADSATLSSRAAARAQDQRMPASYAPAEPQERLESYAPEPEDTQGWRIDETEDHSHDFRPEWAEPEHHNEQAPAAETANGRPNLNTVFTVGTLLLLFVGPRFLDPGLILPALLALIAARWIYGRWANSSSSES